MGNANPFADLDGDDDRRGANPGRKKPATPAARRRVPVWAYAVALLVAVAAGLFIYDQVQTRYHKARLQSIKAEWFDLYDKIRDREKAVDAANPHLSEESISKAELAELLGPSTDDKRPKPKMSPDRARELRRQLIANDPDLKRLRQQIWDIEQERERIYRDHPEWRRQQGEWRY